MNPIKFGSIGIFIAIIAHVIVLMLFFSEQSANGTAPLVAVPDLFIWVVLCFLFFGLGVLAAEKQYDAQRNDLDPLNGVRAAGVGTALVMCAGNWFLMFIRAFFLDATGLVILVEPISLLVVIFITVIFAFLFGSAAGNSVENKYRHVNYEDY
jgi:hypothetical protein